MKLSGEVRTLTLSVLCALLFLGARCAPGDEGFCATCVPDARVDGATPTKCGGQVCEGATPYCNETTNTCVACLENSQCTDASKTKCDTATNTCVACLATTDCTDPTKSVCDTSTKSCIACNDNAQCGHIAGKGICSSGTCVQCSTADEAACTQGVCDLTQNVCTTLAANSAGTCQACVNDKQCDVANNYRCVPMNFQGTPRAGGYCLKPLSAGCTRPYTVPLTDRASLSQPGTQDTYCGVAESTTTCEAALSLVNDVECLGNQDSECGAAGLNDGLCKTVNGLAKRCTYACTLSSQCPEGADCNTYCGGL